MNIFHETAERSQHKQLCESLQIAVRETVPKHQKYQKHESRIDLFVETTTPQNKSCRFGYDALLNSQGDAGQGTALLHRPVDRQRRTWSQRQHDVGLWQRLTARPRAPVPEWTKSRAGGKLPGRVALALARRDHSRVARQALCLLRVPALAKVLRF